VNIQNERICKETESMRLLLSNERKRWAGGGNILKNGLKTGFESYWYRRMVNVGVQHWIYWCGWLGNNNIGITSLPCSDDNDIVSFSTTGFDTQSTGTFYQNCRSSQKRSS